MGATMTCKWNKLNLDIHLWLNPIHVSSMFLLMQDNVLDSWLIQPGCTSCLRQNTTYYYSPCHHPQTICRNINTNKPSYKPGIESYFQSYKMTIMIKCRNKRSMWSVMGQYQCWHVLKTDPLSNLAFILVIQTSYMFISIWLSINVAQLQRWHITSEHKMTVTNIYYYLL